MADSTMKITLLAFAQARDLLGFGERKVVCAKGLDASGIVESVLPGARQQLPPTTRVAIDLQYAAWSDKVQDGQTLAIIPPVSGG